MSHQHTDSVRNNITRTFHNRAKAPARPVFTVAVPVVHFGSSAQRLVHCLEAQEYPRQSFECILVDDGTTGNIQEFLYQCDSPVRLVSVSSSVAHSSSAAKNLAWRAGQGEITVFVNEGALPDPKWLCDYAEMFGRGNYDVVFGTRHPVQVNRGERFCHRLGAVTRANHFESRPAGDNSPVDTPSSHVFGTLNDPLFQDVDRQLRQAISSCPESLICAFAFVSANVAVRRSCLERIRGFDQSLRTAEDTDVGIRLWEAGAHFGYAEGANTHHDSCSTGASDRPRAEQMARFFYRHPYRLILLLYLWYLRQSGESQEGTPTGDLQSVLREAFDGDLDVSGEFRKLEGQWVPPECSLTGGQIANYFADTFGISRAVVSEYLDQAVAQGLYTRKHRSKTCFDFGLTNNWLSAKSSLCERIIRLGSYMWNQRGLLIAKRKSSDIRSVLYRGVYEISMRPMIARDWRAHAVINIPLPVENSAQRAVSFKQCWPPDLLDYADVECHMIHRYPWPKGQHDIHISYEFECEVREIRASGGGDTMSDSDLSDHLLPASTSEERCTLEGIMKQVETEGPRDPYRLAKRIYYWILDNTSYYVLPAQFDSKILKANQILNTGFGMCVDHARLFIQLCRLAAIPARECCGAVLARKVDLDRFVTLESKTHIYSPFVHTWAECHVPDKGWIPVEFMAWLYGERSLTSLNVSDLQLRGEIIRRTRGFDKYCFGSLDPYRIHVANSANQHLVSVEYERNRVQPPGPAGLGIEHCLRCSIVGAA